MYSEKQSQITLLSLIEFKIVQQTKIDPIYVLESLDFLIHLPYKKYLGNYDEVEAYQGLTQTTEQTEHLILVANGTTKKDYSSTQFTINMSP